MTFIEVCRAGTGPLRFSPVKATGLAIVKQRPGTHSDGLGSTEWEKEVEHSVRVAKRVLTSFTTRYPDLFQSKKVPCM